MFACSLKYRFCTNVNVDPSLNAPDKSHTADLKRECLLPPQMDCELENPPENLVPAETVNEEDEFFINSANFTLRRKEKASASVSHCNGKNRACKDISFVSTTMPSPPTLRLQVIYPLAMP